MAWANSDGSFNNYDMDSEGKKLKVRNTTGTLGENEWRAEIKETNEGDSLEKALRVVGKLDISTGVISPNNPKHCGLIRGLTNNNETYSSLEINTEHVYSDDPPIEPIGEPDLFLGWRKEWSVNDQLYGNTVYINGKQIGICVAPVTGDTVTMRAPIRIVGAATFAGEGQLIVPGRIIASLIDGLLPVGTPPVSELKIGARNATLIEIADADVQTDIKGSLIVRESSEFQDDMTIIGSVNSNHVETDSISCEGDTLIGGNLTVQTNASVTGTISGATLQGTSLDINGNGDISGNLDVHGQLNLFGEVTVEAITSIKQDDGSSTTLTLKNTGSGGEELALEVAVGNTKLGGTLEVDYKTTFNSAIKMKDNEVILHEDPEAGDSWIQYANNRIEFVFKGQARCYIDDTGIHNI